MSNNNFMNRHIEGADTCVICGRDIPEGRQVCVICGDVSAKAANKTVNCDRFSFLSDEIPMPTDEDMPIDYKEPCYVCNNARLDPELTDYNDFNSGTIGSFSKDCRIMLTSGFGNPLRIEIARWNDSIQQWVDIGIYYPKFCPECGREIWEYRK